MGHPKQPFVFIIDDLSELSGSYNLFLRKLAILSHGLFCVALAGLGSRLGLGVFRNC